MAGQVDDGVMTAIMSGMAMSAAGAQESRLRGFDQLSVNAAGVWTGSLVSPTVMGAFGYRVASEAGSNRTRAETNNPGNTGAPGGN